LLPDARHVVVPDGVVATGFPSVQATCREIGIEFDSWQVDLNTLILAKDSTGQLAADTVAISIPRQVGKTFDVGAIVFAVCIINPGTTVVWTAHRFKVARETFDSLRAMARSVLLAPHINYDAITTAAGNETIPFRNGSRIVFAARERGTVRGFSKVRILVLDEAQILTESALADMAPTMNQAVDPQIIMMGTPPKPTDPAEVFSNLRAQALAGTSEGVLYVEMGADPGSDPDDRAAWAKANASFPHRTPERAILRLRKLLDDDDFLREVLGIWEEGSSARVIDAASWARCADPFSAATDRLALGVDVNPERTRASVSLAGEVPGERWHVELDEQRDGVGWVVPWVVQRVGNNPLRAVVIDAASPAASLIADFDAARVRVTTTGPRDMAQACGWFYDGVMEGRLVHTDQPQMNAALGAARKRPLAGAWGWNRANSASDITPVVAATLALFGARAGDVKRPNRGLGRTSGNRVATVF
jgi:phage terminase large subunit-like protein